MQLPSERSERRSGRSDVRHELDRMFEDFLGRSVRGWTNWSPPADLYETDDEYILELEVPGFERDEIELTLEQGILTIGGQRSSEREARERAYRVRERSTGRFTRSFSLPRAVDPGEVEAEMRDGVLRVRMQKAADAKPRKIDVTVK